MPRDDVASIGSMEIDESRAYIQAEQRPLLPPLPAGRALEQQLHWALYGLLQTLRGRPVGAFIRQFQAWERLEPAEFVPPQQARLAEALAYARARVPLYSTGTWARALSCADPTNILAWPILDRATVQRHEAELVARPALPGIFFHSTSGSCGPPLRFALDPVSRSWDLAASYRAWLWYGIAPVARTFRLLARVDDPLREWVMNRRASAADDITPQRLEGAARTLISWRPTLLWTFPSAAFQLARFIRETRPLSSTPLVPYAFLSGESVFPFQRREIERSLAARVIQGYAASDVGWLAMECPAGSMHILADYVHLEILRDGAPVPDGEFGDIVVTPLFNRAMPLVRYSVGDQGALSPDPCPCGKPLPVLAELKARTADVMVTADGRPVHASALTSGLDDIFLTMPADEVRQVLFEQIDQRTWRVLVETDRPINEAIAVRLADVVRRSFGAKCEVTVEPVPVIPREPSGKFRYYRGRIAGQGIPGPGSLETP